MLITREIQIDAGHRIPRHGGMCQGLHGHRYRILCSVFCDEPGKDAETDMAMDFSVLKRIMMEQIHMDHDHALILVADDPIIGAVLGEGAARVGAGVMADYAAVQAGTGPAAPALCAVGRVEHGTRFVLLPHQPTAERLAEYWGAAVHRAVQAHTNGRCSLVEITVWETPNCCAAWVPQLSDSEAF